MITQRLNGTYLAAPKKRKRGQEKGPAKPKVTGKPCQSGPDPKQQRAPQVKSWRKPKGWPLKKAANGDDDDDDVYRFDPNPPVKTAKRTGSFIFPAC